MPAPKWLLEASRIQPLPGRTTKPLRLFRALLRECTYLPDPAARIYMRNHIISRYRAYHPKSMSEKEYMRPLLAERFTHINKTARKGLTQLQKANAGYFEPLLKVLLMTYGRLGKRRYELLEPLKKSEIGSPKLGSDMVSRKLSQLSTHPSTVEKVPKLSSQLQALLQSQRSTKPPHTTRAMLRRVELVIPPENIWKIPTPQKRIVHIVKEWYGEMLYKTLPPLPEAEWLRLQKLASGHKREHIVPRRPRGTATETNGSPHSEAAFLLGPELEQELRLGPTPRPVSTSVPHDLTPRYMQRMWLKVFDLCPMMTWDLEHKVWRTRWGCAIAEKPGSMSKRQRNARLLEYFEFDGMMKQESRKADQA